VYKAAIQNISSIFDKESNERELVIVSYGGTFTTSDEANLFAKHSRIGIRKKKELIELCWSDNENVLTVIDIKDIHYYDKSEPTNPKSKPISKENYTLNECLEAIWSYDGFCGDEGFMWLPLEAYGSKKVD